MSQSINKQLEKLEELRKVRDGDEEQVTPEQPAEQPRNEDGTFKKVEGDERVVEDPDDDPNAGDGDDDDDAATGDEPTGVEVDLDGEKIVVDPTIAAILAKDDERRKGKPSAAPELNEDRIVDKVVSKLAPVLHPPVDPAAEAAIQAQADAEEQSRIDKLKPDKDLFVTDPSKWQEQHDKWLEARDEFKTKKLKRELQAEHAKPTPEQQRAAQEQANQARDTEARDILRVQFERAFPVLSDPTMKDTVDAELKVQFDEVVASGVVTPGHANFKPMTAAQREAFKHEQFEEAAARIARRLVKDKQARNKLVAPKKREGAQKPPATVTGQSQTREKPKKVEAPKPKPKYPADSMSALMAERRSKKLA